VPPLTSTELNQRALNHFEQAQSMATQQQWEQALKQLALSEDYTRQALSSTAIPHQASIKHNLHQIQLFQANLLYQQAMARLEGLNATYDATQQLNHATLQLLETSLVQAHAMAPHEAAIQKGRANACQFRAKVLMRQQQWPEAITALKQAKALDPGSSTQIDTILAKLLVRQAYVTQNPEEKQAALQEARQLDPWVKISGENGHNPQTVAEQAPRQSGLPAPVSSNTASLTVAEMLTSVETQLDIVPPDKQSLLKRLNTCEERIYGTPQSGSLNVRAKNLYTAVQGPDPSRASAGSQTFTSDNQPVVLPPQSGENASLAANDYLAQILTMTDGKIIRWGRFPLRVYVDEPKSEPRFQASYKQAILTAFTQWQELSGGMLRVVPVKHPDFADIQVHWSPTAMDPFDEVLPAPLAPPNDKKPSKTPSPQEKYSHLQRPKNHPMSKVLMYASMFTPGYFSLIPQVAGAALQYKQLAYMQALMEESKLVLPLPPETLNPAQQTEWLHQMTLHYAGHALGLKGHSDQATDVMFAVPKEKLTETTVTKPTQRDLETLRQLYARPANVVLNVR
jgi:predicted Zn-dependent protease